MDPVADFGPMSSKQISKTLKKKKQGCAVPLEIVFTSEVMSMVILSLDSNDC